MTRVSCGPTWDGKEGSNGELRDLPHSCPDSLTDLRPHKLLMISIANSLSRYKMVLYKCCRKRDVTLVLPRAITSYPASLSVSMSSGETKHNNLYYHINFYPSTSPTVTLQKGVVTPQDLKIMMNSKFQFKLSGRKNYVISLSLLMAIKSVLILKL